MLTRLKAIALSTIIAVGGFAAMPSAAQADRLVIGVGPQGVQVRHVDRRHHVRPLPPRRAQCTPVRAVEKAQRMGLRNARVVANNRNVIRVRGFDRFGPEVVRFAKAPGCPVIR